MKRKAVIDAAPGVARLVDVEFGKDEVWQQKQVVDFVQLANQYLLVPYKG